MTVKFKDHSSDVGHSTPSYSSFKRRSQRQLQRNSDRRDAWIQRKKSEVSQLEQSDFVSDTSKPVNFNNEEDESGHLQDTCISSDLVPPVRPQPSVECITQVMHDSSLTEHANSSATCENADNQKCDANIDCLSNLDKVRKGLARWRYPKYPSWAKPKDMAFSPQEDPYCFYCDTQIKRCEHIEYCASCIENYGNEKHNIACEKCAHRIPEYCTCVPFHVTKGTYPDVDPYDGIIPIT